MRLDRRRARSDLLEAFKIINGHYHITADRFFLNLMTVKEGNIAKSYSREEAGWI